LVDCDKINGECNGGEMTTAYGVIMNMSGIESETNYKYLGHEQRCQFDRTKVHVYINESVNITQDENGEKGYYRVYRGNETCGVNMMCSSALVDE
ncbi:unnamed protein product, partial [Didymodactylos carnosus]